MRASTPATATLAANGGTKHIPLSFADVLEIKTKHGTFTFSEPSTVTVLCPEHPHLQIRSSPDAASLGDSFIGKVKSLGELASSGSDTVDVSKAFGITVTSGTALAGAARHEEDSVRTPRPTPPTGSAEHTAPISAPAQHDGNVDRPTVPAYAYHTASPEHVLPARPLAGPIDREGNLNRPVYPGPIASDRQFQLNRPVARSTDCKGLLNRPAPPGLTNPVSHSGPIQPATSAQHEAHIINPHVPQDTSNQIQ